MSEFKGTPGPWVRRGSVIKALGGNERKVADVRVLDAEGEANAKLVEAAPDLLAAAIEVLNGLNERIDLAVADRTSTPVFEGIAALHDAINQATA